MPYPPPVTIASERPERTGLPVLFQRPLTIDLAHELPMSALHLNMGCCWVEVGNGAKVPQANSSYRVGVVRHWLPKNPRMARPYATLVLSVVVIVEPGPWLRLCYEYDGHPYECRVKLVPIVSNLGAGVYYHFQCPVSGANCKTLYWRPEMPGTFAHRAVLQIRYASQYGRRPDFSVEAQEVREVIS